MPKQKAPKGAASSAASSDQITDPRFTNFLTDPRFRLPSKKHTRTKIDKRFSSLLKDPDVLNSSKVDRYGRKLETNSKRNKALEKLYVEESDEDEKPKKHSNVAEDSDDDEEVDNELGIGEDDLDDDEEVEAELKKAASYDPARGGGFSESDSSDEDEEPEVEIEEADFPDLQAESAEVEMGEVTSRLAVVNMDWDHIRAVDLMAVFQSFVPTGGRIQKISVYQSDFGTERIAREETEGPEFGDAVSDEGEEESADSEDSDDDEKIKKKLQQEDDGQELNSSKYRQYQLERLRYYYAVMECSDNDTAQKIYEATDGREYLSSANAFDLRFIPEGTEFDNVLRDSCDSVPPNYQPIEFVTDALQHSKVKLTWDMDPEEGQRKEAIKRAFTGSRSDIAMNDLTAYVGNSDSSESEPEPEVEAEEKPKSKKELERERIRAALGLSDDIKPKKSKSGHVGDLEITFTPGISAGDNKKSVFENGPEALIEETTAERYIRKEKERKARRKEKAKALREGRDPDAEEEIVEEEKEEKDLGFDDPFFAADAEEKSKASKALRKEERRKKRDLKDKERQEKEQNKKELELLMPDADHGGEHFDINEIARMEKRKKKKGRKGEKEKESKRGGLQEGFEIDTQDPRFGVVFEKNEYAIDRSHPKFKGTEGMKKLLEEGRKRRGIEDDGEVRQEKKRKVR